MKFVSKAAVLSAAAGVAVVGGAGVASAYGAGAAGAAQNSPGVLSGNLVQVPVEVPVNVCGNTVNIVALLNPVFGNTCLNA
ncbi:chaplin [Streptomyces tubercidicus]|uniref:chaplin n=1 Tax=Streptomyces tubercidicus TaxID=47759 RepID=UPI002E142396|nr:chaplin [Streptomyces tubercidicus]WSX22060.1 chaplin [Streptomyces tubercidicus]